LHAPRTAAINSCFGVSISSADFTGIHPEKGDEVETQSCWQQQMSGCIQIQVSAGIKSTKTLVVGEYFVRHLLYYW